MQRLLVAVTLRPGRDEEAAALIRAGPPFDPAQSGLTRHSVYVSAGEAVFAFEGPSLEHLIRSIVTEPVFEQMLGPWARLTQGRPRLLLEQYHWHAEDQVRPAA